MKPLSPDEQIALRRLLPVFKRWERDSALIKKVREAPPRPEGFEQGTYVLKVTLTGVSRPSVWRRIRVPSDIKMGKLHRVLQVSFGWEDDHKHKYTAKPNVGFGSNPCFGKIGYEGNISDARVLHEAVLVEDAEFAYVYDFGDWWSHKIKVEKILGPGDALAKIECLDGKGACPPEDCGGPSGYATMKAIMETPTHPEHEDVIEWLGKSFDATAFSVAEVNRRLRLIK